MTYSTDELTKRTISDMHDDYHRLHDAVWQHLEKAICDLEELNDVVWTGDDEVAFEVAGRDVELLKAKLNELEQKLATFKGASRPGYRPFSMPAFPSIRK